jgi:hypothetical protein
VSIDPHSQRFDQRGLSRGIGTDGEQAFAASDASPISWNERLSGNVTDRELDEALEQIASERRCERPRGNSRYARRSDRPKPNLGL